MLIGTGKGVFYLEFTFQPQIRRLNLLIGESAGEIYQESISAAAFSAIMGVNATPIPLQATAK